MSRKILGVAGNPKPEVNEAGGGSNERHGAFETHITRRETSWVRRGEGGVEGVRKVRVKVEGETKAR